MICLILRFQGIPNLALLRSQTIPRFPQNIQIIPTLALTLDFSLKNTLFNMVLFVKIPVIRVIRCVRKSFVAKM